MVWWFEVPSAHTSWMDEHWARVASGSADHRRHAERAGMSGRWSLPPLDPLQLGFTLQGVAASHQASDNDCDADHGSQAGIGLGSKHSPASLGAV
jgi:hypothetical protein